MASFERSEELPAGASLEAPPEATLGGKKERKRKKKRVLASRVTRVRGAGASRYFNVGR